MNPGAHHLPRIPHTSLLPITLYCHPVFSRRLFLLLIFLFILIAFSGLFLLDPSSILPVQCNAMGHSSFLLTFPYFSCLSLFFHFISYLFYLVAHYIAKRFCIEKKYRIIIFFIPPCNKNICAPLQKFRGDLSDRPLHCPGDCTCVNE